MSTHTFADLSILLLAGGQGQRMGGRDKGLVDWHGRPLIAWMHDVARPLTDDLLISCNRNQDRYATFADRLVSDREPTYPGPLTGIRAGLSKARNGLLMVLPCDAPLIDQTLLVQLFEAALMTPGLPVMVRRGEQWEPLFCVIPVDLAPNIEEAWKMGERSNREVLLKLKAQRLQLPGDDRRLANLNSPDLLTTLSPTTGT